MKYRNFITISLLALNIGLNATTISQAYGNINVFKGLIRKL